MTHTDQPNCFPNTLLAVVSSKADGTMLNREKGVHHTDSVANRERFCAKNDISYEDVVYQKIIYGDNESYELVKGVGKQDTTRYTPELHADALFTSEIGVGLFLPVADCVATVVYDPKQRLLALLHLGRHSTLTNLIGKTLNCFQCHGSDPSDLLVWMSPSAKKDTYRLDWFDDENDPRWQGFITKKDGYFLDLPGYNRQVFIDSGIAAEHIFISEVDTTKNPNYFSHTGDKTADRIAVLAMMR